MPCIEGSEGVHKEKPAPAAARRSLMGIKVERRICIAKHRKGMVSLSIVRIGNGRA